MSKTKFKITKLFRIYKKLILKQSRIKNIERILKNCRKKYRKMLEKLKKKLQKNARKMLEKLKKNYRKGIEKLWKKI